MGLGVDLGNNATYFGPQFKQKFGEKVAIQGQVMFSDFDYMYVGLDYQYGDHFPETTNVAWYVGVGPQVAFRTDGDSKALFALRPQAGLEFKLPEVPLGIHFDWKPWWKLTKGGNFVAGKFTLGVKFVL